MLLEAECRTSYRVMHADKELDRRPASSIRSVINCTSPKFRPHFPQLVGFHRRNGAVQGRYWPSALQSGAKLYSRYKGRTVGISRARHV